VARSVLTTFVALCLSLCAPAVWSQAQRLPVVKLNIGSHTLSAEVAATAESRRYGLMHRQQLPDNHGMLFVFDHDDTYCFWMRNTPLPLSIAFIAHDGAIINLADMAPNTTDSHCALEPVRYALEMEQGWFAQHGIGSGDYIRNLASP